MGQLWKAMSLALYLLPALPALPGHAQVAFGNGDYFEDGSIFHSRKQLDDYRLVRDLYGCTGAHFYAREDESAPAGIAASLAQPDKAALVFRTCTDRATNMHYFVREPMTAAMHHIGNLLTGGRPSPSILERLNGSPIRPLPPGLCRVFEYEVFPDGPAGWSEAPPQAWSAAGYQPGHTDLAMVTDRACPPGSDPGYFSVTNVPNGLLVNFVKTWRGMVASPSAFDKAFAQSAVAGQCIWFPPDFKPGGQKLGPAVCPQMREQFRALALDGRTKITAVGCDPVAGICTARLGDYDIGFDVADRGAMAMTISYHWEMKG